MRYKIDTILKQISKEINPTTTDSITFIKAGR